MGATNKRTRGVPEASQGELGAFVQPHIDFSPFWILAVSFSEDD